MGSNDDSNLSPELVEAILSGYSDEPRSFRAKRQLEQAQGLQSEAMGANSPGFMAGRVFVPSGAGSVLSRAAQGYFGGRMQREGDTQMDQLAAGRQARMGQAVAAMRRRQRSALPAATAALPSTAAALPSTALVDDTGLP